MSVPNKIRKWVVEKFDGISPGLIDTHIVRFCEKIAIFKIWGQRALGPKICPRGPNCLKYDCWGPGKSIDTHIVGPVENIPGQSCLTIAILECSVDSTKKIGAGFFQSKPLF